MAFGGAGPLHAARLARELEIGGIVVPRNPGILCAMGLLLTDLRADFAMTRLHTLSIAALPDVADAFHALRAQADAWFAEAGIAPDACRITHTVDMRYAGQNYELPVVLPDGEVGPAMLDALAEGFAAAHRADVRFHRRGRTRVAWSPSASRQSGSCRRRHSSDIPTQDPMPPPPSSRDATSGCPRPGFRALSGV